MIVIHLAEVSQLLTEENITGVALIVVIVPTVAVHELQNGPIDVVIASRSC